MKISLTGLLLLSLVTVFGQSSFFIYNGASNGSGTKDSPFNDFNHAKSHLHPGDTLFVMPGIYELPNLVFFRNQSGTPDSRITVKAMDFKNKPVLSVREQIVMDRVFRFERSEYITIDGLILEGKFRDEELIYISYFSTGVEIKNCVLRYAPGAINIRDVDDVLISNCEISYILRGSREDPEDAHGINMYDSENLRVIGTKTIHCTGDGIQCNWINSHWNNVLIEDCEFAAAPLDRDVWIFKEGDILGENGIDTKTPPGLANRSEMTIRNVKVHGYSDVEYYGRRAALNLKHEVKVIVDRAEVYDNEIGMRLRGAYIYRDQNLGSSNVTLINNVLYNNAINLRLEEHVENTKIYNTTFDKQGNQRHFDITDHGHGVDLSSLDIRNCFFYGEKPMQYNETAHESNLIATDADFVNRESNNYMLTSESNAINAAVNIDIVKEDFLGTKRFQDSYDVGAFEYNGNTIYVTSIDISSPNGIGTLTHQGQKLQLTASVLPAYATNKSITWEIIQGKYYASINQSGVVTAINEGSIVVAAKANDGSDIFGIYNLEIKYPDAIPVNEIIISSDNDQKEIYAIGANLKLNAEVLPANASNKNIKWAIEEGSSNATISESGVVTAINVGSVKIRASALDGSGTSGYFDLTIQPENNNEPSSLHKKPDTDIVRITNNQIRINQESGHEDQLYVRIISICGQVLYDSFLVPGQVIELEQFNPGIYIFQYKYKNELHSIQFFTY